MITKTCSKIFILGMCCLIQTRWFPSKCPPNPIYSLHSGIKLSDSLKLSPGELSLSCSQDYKALCRCFCPLFSIGHQEKWNPTKYIFKCLLSTTLKSYNASSPPTHFLNKSKTQRQEAYFKSRTKQELKKKKWEKGLSWNSIVPSVVFSMLGFWCCPLMTKI